jgi:hypothetical protein
MATEPSTPESVLIPQAAFIATAIRAGGPPARVASALWIDERNEQQPPASTLRLLASENARHVSKYFVVCRAAHFSRTT